MKILFAIDEYGPTAAGGSAVIVRNLAHAFSSRHQVAILTSHRYDSPFLKHPGNPTIYSLKINYHPLLRAYLSLYNPTINSRLRQVLNDFRPDVVHAHTIHTYLSYHLLHLARQFTPRVLFTAHDVMPVFYGRLTQFTDQDHDGIPDTLDPHFHFLKELKNHHLYFNPLRNPLIRRYLNQTQVITVSHALEQVFQVNGIHVHQVIHNGVDVNLWKAHPAKITAFRKKYSLQGKPVLLLAGRIRPDKGSLLAIRILNQLPKNTVLLLAGKKDRGVAQALDYAQSLDIKPRVIPTGFLSQPQLNTAYHAANAILVPSLYLDPFPTVVIEGMACQKVVITTSFGGAREAIEQRKTGLIINPFNLSQTAKEIYKVLIQPNKYNQLAIRAFQTAQNRLSLKKQISSYLRAYTTSNYGN